ncbi:MAG TPA: DUF3048 domain-containing protein [Candidatus Paceibacterota bacterium]|nr:DUF3048 domain-containing protein [Candidatus Paceibacterota bacterium]
MHWKSFFSALLRRKRWLALGIAGIVGLVFLGVWLSRSIQLNIIGHNVQSQPTSPIAGLPCDNAIQRPVAVMLASDPEARPLSGIGQADLVIEMPVTPDGITRFMTVFQCQTPKEIGSVRSAREDFIPLAAGFDSVYAHWGGEHGALDELNQHVIDNVNALYYDGTIFYRKPGIPAPHNGFTTLDLLRGQATKLGYDLTKNFSGYLHSTDAPVKNLSNVASSIAIPYSGYSGLDNVDWMYNAANNAYLRSRGHASEIDKNTGQQVQASAVVLMHTDSHILREGDQYIVVRTTGSGPADIYQNGIVISGTWQKDAAALDSPLRFFDNQNKEIKFVPGSIWIEIVTSS